LFLFLFFQIRKVLFERKERRKEKVFHIQAKKKKESGCVQVSVFFFVAFRVFLDFCGLFLNFVFVFSIWF